MQDDVPWVFDRKLRARQRSLELLLWLLFALILGGDLSLAFIAGRASLDTLLANYWQFMAVLLIMVFPVLFQLVFGHLPIEALRIGISNARSAARAARDRDASRDNSVQPKEAPPPEVQEPGSVHQTRKDTGEVEANRTWSLGASVPGIGTVTFFHRGAATAGSSDQPDSKLGTFARASRSLAGGIYTRALVYLFMGVIIAFSGLVFFYVETAVAVARSPLPSALSPSTGAASIDASILLNMVPKFGILFFIEFVAIFFLRQYRAAMDDFRYYDSVARTREEVVALLELGELRGEAIQLVELVKQQAFFSRSGVLLKDQTTEVIETRKLEKTEVDLLERVIDAIRPKK